MTDYWQDHEWDTTDFWMVCPARVVDKYSEFGPPKQPDKYDQITAIMNDYNREE